jgi:NitT/TauT family transport system substrate-binding protein
MMVDAQEGQMLRRAAAQSPVRRLDLLVLLVALVACQGAPAQPAPAPAPAGAPAPTSAPAAAAPPAPAAQPTAVRPLSPPVEVKMGVLNTLGDAGIYLALERGYFEAEGLQVELVPFRSGQEQIPAVATNQIQFASGSLDVSILNAVARDVNIRIVQDKGRNGDTYSGAGIVVRSTLYANGTVDELAKMKGKSLGISVIGTTTDLYLQRALQPVGLTLDDISMTVVPMTDMAGALANGAVDSAWLFEPWTALVTGADIGRILIDSSKIAPDFYSQFLIVSEQFARENPEAVRRFVTAHLRGQRDYYRAFVLGEGGDREAIIGYWMKYTSVKDRALYDRMGYGAVEPNGYIDPAILEVFQDWAFDNGRLPQKVDIRKLIDPQYIQYAVERLGRLPERFH